MADWRRVDKKIWTDKKIMRLSVGARLLFVGLITIADDDGYMDVDPIVLKAQLFPADDAIPVTDLSRWRDELVTESLLVCVETAENEYGHLPKFERYQSIRKDTYKESTIKKDIELAKSVTGPLQVRNESVTGPLRTHTHTVHTHSTDTEKEPAPPSAGLGVQNQTGKTAREINGALVDKVRRLWSTSFGPSKMPDYPLAQKILNQCRDRDLSPAWVFHYVRDNHPDDPRKYVLWILKPGNSDRPLPDEGGMSYAQWEHDATTEADRKKPRLRSGPSRVGELLPK